MKKTIYYLLAIALFLSACGKDDDQNGDCNNESISITWNGSSVNNEDGFNNTYLEETQFGQRGRRIDLRTNVDGGILVLSVANWDWQNPPSEGVHERIYYTEDGNPNAECREIDGFDFCESALAKYIIGNKQYYSDESAGNITITSCDNVNRVISGTYNVTMVEFFNEEDTISASGTFTDLCYRLL